ncbi:helix-turn-helix transcriptional regulator [Catenovulum sediminis]|uniref:Helix-turn-helix domain-containing protein n=1 Tax=Catenovulum sediminis TaxID=1740262 RepID=A0ABV1RI59_9ALTE
MNIESLTNDKLITTRDVVNMLGVSRRTIYNYTRDHGFPKPTSKPGCRKLWRLSDVEAWINQDKEAA